MQTGIDRAAEVVSLSPPLKKNKREPNMHVKGKVCVVTGAASGIGDAVASAVSPEGVRVHKLGVHELPRSGKPEELMDHYGISAAKIAAKVRSL